MYAYSRKNAAISLMGTSVILILLTLTVVLGVFTIRTFNGNNDRISFQNLAGSSTPYADSSTSVNTQVSSTCIAETTTATETISQSTTASSSVTSSSSSASTSTSCKVLTTMAPKGATMASFSNGALVFTGLYNFTTGTVAKNFTLKGNFISPGYFYLRVGYFNHTSYINRNGGLIYANSTLQTNGSYTLNLNLNVPIEPARDHYDYNVYINSYPSGASVNVTSNFVMITCTPAQLVENSSFYQSG